MLVLPSLLLADGIIFYTGLRQFTCSDTGIYLYSTAEVQYESWSILTPSKLAANLAQFAILTGFLTSTDIEGTHTISPNSKAWLKTLLLSPVGFRGEVKHIECSCGNACRWMVLGSTKYS